MTGKFIFVSLGDNLKKIDKMKRFFFSLLLGSLFALGLFSATVDTIQVFRPSMNKDVKTVVIKPQSDRQKRSFPVLYLLHGHGGRYDRWILDAPHLTDLADRYEMMIVCPDGGVNSWYWDSPVDPAVRYETFVTRELIAYVDSQFNTLGMVDCTWVFAIRMFLEPVAAFVVEWISAHFRKSGAWRNSWGHCVTNLNDGRSMV